HRRDVNRLGHLVGVRSVLQALRGIGVDAIRALFGVRHGQRDQSLLAFGQRAVFAGHGVVIVEKLLGQLASELAYLPETAEVFGFVIIHRSSPPELLSACFACSLSDSAARSSRATLVSPPVHRGS